VLEVIDGLNADLDESTVNLVRVGEVEKAQQCQWQRVGLDNLIKLVERRLKG
jgi:hypothetical protein